MRVADACTHLRYLDAPRAAVAGTSCEKMAIRAENGETLGRLEGLVVDPAGRHVHYFVIRTPGLFGKSRLVPVMPARVDFGRREIELPLNRHELQRALPFAAAQFAPFSDDDLLAAIFGRPAEPPAASAA